MDSSCLFLLSPENPIFNCLRIRWQTTLSFNLYPRDHRPKICGPWHSSSMTHFGITLYSFGKVGRLRWSHFICKRIFFSSNPTWVLFLPTRNHNVAQLFPSTFFFNQFETWQKWKSVPRIFSCTLLFDHGHTYHLSHLPSHSHNNKLVLSKVSSDNTTVLQWGGWSMALSFAFKDALLTSEKQTSECEPLLDLFPSLCISSFFYSSSFLPRCCSVDATCEYPRTKWDTCKQPKMGTAVLFVQVTGCSLHTCVKKVKSLGQLRRDANFQTSAVFCCHGFLNSKRENGYNEFQA